MTNPDTKREMKAYRDANVRLYGCWACKNTRTTLYKVGRGLYACVGHRKTPMVK